MVVLKSTACKSNTAQVAPSYKETPMQILETTIPAYVINTDKISCQVSVGACQAYNSMLQLCTQRVELAINGTKIDQLDQSTKSAIFAFSCVGKHAWIGIKNICSRFPGSLTIITNKDKAGVIN